MVFCSHVVVHKSASYRKHYNIVIISSKALQVNKIRGLIFVNISLFSSIGFVEINKDTPDQRYVGGIDSNLLSENIVISCKSGEQRAHRVRLPPSHRQQVSSRTVG